MPALSKHTKGEGSAGSIWEAQTFSRKYSWYEMVALMTTQVEILFGELGYIESRLKTVGIADDEVSHV